MKSETSRKSELRKTNDINAKYEGFKINAMVGTFLVETMVRGIANLSV